MNSNFRAALFAGILLTGATQANAHNYTFTDLGTLGGTISGATAINNLGQVVGFANITSNAAQHATLWNGTTAIDLGTLDGTYSYAASINNAGQIVGSASTIAAGNGPNATLWNGGTIPTNLGTLGGTQSGAASINNVGQVVGTSLINGNTAYRATFWTGTTATGLSTYSTATSINNYGKVVGSATNKSYSHATLWDSTVTTDLGTLGGNYSWANAINDLGQVVGAADTANNERHAALWTGTTVTDLDPTGSQSEANAINDIGQAVGYTIVYDKGIGVGHAMLWNGTTTTDLNKFLNSNTLSSGWLLSTATGINDSEAIVGSAYNSLTNQTHAFLLSASGPVSAVPEPETYAMLLTGLGLMAFMARRHNAT